MRLVLLALVAGACGGGQRPAAEAKPPSEAHALPAVDTEAETPVDRYGPGPVAEVIDEPPAIELPPVPGFVLPPSKDGLVTARELRLLGSKHMDKEVRVKGYAVHVYSCERMLRSQGKSRRQVKQLLRDQPELCSRPNFYLADSPDHPKDLAIWVVEVPRPVRPDEKKLLSKEELSSWPKVPVFKEGDQVIVTGTWSLRSPQGFMNSNGLLVYKALERVR